MLVFLNVSLLLAAQQREGDPLAKNSAADSTAQLKKWLSHLVTTGVQDTASSLRLLNQASARAKEQNNLLHEALVQRAGGHLLRNLKLYHRSFAWFLRSDFLFAEVGDPYEMVTAGLELSKAQYFRGNYRQSMQHYSHAIEIATANKIVDKEMEALEILGLLYNAFQNFTEGAAVFRKSLDMKYQLNDAKGILYTLEILSTIYYRHKKYDSSLMYASRALHLAQQHGKQSDMELSRLNRAAALIRLKRFDEAGKEIDQLSKLDVRGSNVNLVVRYNVLMGNYYLARKDDKQAATYYDSALKRADLIRFPELYALIFNNMADSYYDRGDLQKAYQYSRKYTEMVAELYTGEHAISLGNLETVLKTERSEDEIRYLNNENKVKQLQLRNERNLRLLLLMAVTAMLVLGGVIFYLYRKQRRKNAIISKQADDMQVLMKEIHHRVKNNLQVISSLLDLQALSIKHDQAAEAVKVGRNRVQSMALIHQNLYNEGNIKGIKVQLYIETLAQGLFHSYNIKPKSVHLNTDIDDLNLDVDTVIPIGLILNELITNSLKYAFRDKEYGEIWVTLKKAGDKLVLKVRDNGDGFPPDSSMQPETTFGLKLIKAFAQKLKARLSIYNENGACVEMHIARYKIAEQTPVRELV